MTVLDLDQTTADFAKRMASLLPGDVDLDDDTDVVRTLYAHGLSHADFGDVLPAVIDWARIERGAWA